MTAANSVATLFAKHLRRTLRSAQGLYSRSDFVRRVASAFVLQILALVLTFANSAIVTRWLGPEQKGILTLVLLIPNMLALFLSCGISIANIYFVGSRRLSVAQLTSNTMVWSLIVTVTSIIGVGVAAATGMLGTFFPGIEQGLLLLAMVMLPVSMASGSLAAIIQGLQRTTEVSLVNVAQAVSGICFMLTLVVTFGLGASSAMLATIGAASIGLALFAVMIRRVGGTLRPRWDLRTLRLTLGFGLRGHVGNVLQFFNYRLDVFIVNYFLGPVAVGIYSVAVMLAELLWQFPNAIGFVIFPKASASTHTQMNSFTPRVFRATLAITAVGALILAAIGRPFIELIYTSAFAPAYSALLILLPGVVLLGGGKVLTNEIAGRGYASYNSINSGIALVVTLALDVLLIPRYGITGAALASSIAYALNLMLALFFYRRVSRTKGEMTP